jgi:hypothetical protein
LKAGEAMTKKWLDWLKGCELRAAGWRQRIEPNRIRDATAAKLGWEAQLGMDGLFGSARRARCSGDPRTCKSRRHEGADGEERGFGRGVRSQ